MHSLKKYLALLLLFINPSSFFILSAQSYKVILYPPDTAYRTRQKPPSEAIINYYLKEKSNDTVTLDILDSIGNLVMHCTSKQLSPQQILSGDSGSHRFLWDIHYTPLIVPPSHPITTIIGDATPTSPWVMPGTYTVKLTVNKTTYTQPLIVKMDPRVKVSTNVLIEQHDYSMLCYHDRQEALLMLPEITPLQTQLLLVSGKIGLDHDSLNDELDTCYFKLGMLHHLLMDSIPEGRTPLNDKLQELFKSIEAVDAQPTAQCLDETNAANARFEKLWQNWVALQQELKRLNDMLKATGLTELKWIETR